MSAAMVEAILINKVFYDKGIPVAVLPNHPRTGHVSIYTTPTYTVYEIVSLAKKVLMSTVKALLPELRQVIKDYRKDERLTLRWGDSPFSLEVPNKQVRFLDFDKSSWKDLPPYTAVAGRSYAYGESKEHRIDFTNPNTTNLLIAGINGSGKTNTLRTIVSSLARNNTPEQCRFVIIDPKYKSLQAFQNLPHTVGWTSDPYEAHKLIGWVHGEMERRKTDEYNGKIFLVTEELSYLALEDMRDAFERMLPQISLFGRELDIHILAVSQRPTAGLIGGQLKSQFGVRMVHRLDTADNARFVSGKAGTGAENLHGFGSFLLIDDADKPAHLQAYHIPQIETVINEIVRVYPSDNYRVSTSLEPLYVSPKTIEMEEQKERARPVFQKYWDARKGRLKTGGQTAIIHAIFGEGTYTGGGNRATMLKIVEELTSEQPDKKNGAAKGERIRRDNRKPGKQSTQERPA